MYVAAVNFFCWFMLWRLSHMLTIKCFPCSMKQSDIMCQLCFVIRDIHTHMWFARGLWLLSCPQFGGCASLLCPSQDIYDLFIGVQVVLHAHTHAHTHTPCSVTTQAQDVLIVCCCWVSICTVSIEQEMPSDIQLRST